MGIRKVKRVAKMKEKETKFDKLVSWIQLVAGLIFSVYGLITNNTIIAGIGGVLILFCNRRIDISIPFKEKGK